MSESPTDENSAPDEAISQQRLVLPEVAGRMLECSTREFEHRCKVWLATEQGKPLPDNALVALLCDGVRLAREYTDQMETLAGI